MRLLAKVLVALIPFGVGAAASAQTYLDRPVRVVTGFAAGGLTDVTARIIADTLSTRFGKQFYVVNQPGADSNTATGMVATSPADGGCQRGLHRQSDPHLSGEIFRIANDLDLRAVQFTGAAPAIQATVGGHTPVAFSAMPPAAPQIQQGVARAEGR